MALNREFGLERTYRQGAVQYARLLSNAASKSSAEATVLDIGQYLVREGFVLADIKPFFRKHKALGKIGEMYRKKESEAKSEHVSADWSANERCLIPLPAARHLEIWRYHRGRSSRLDWRTGGRRVCVSECE